MLNPLPYEQTRLAAQVSSYVQLLLPAPDMKIMLQAFLHIYLILTGQSPNWIEMTNAAKLQFSEV